MVPNVSTFWKGGGGGFGGGGGESVLVCWDGGRVEAEREFIALKKLVAKKTVEVGVKSGSGAS